MEKDKPLVSIIVPVYNVEQYLDRCVESILAQTLPDFELILVDDGSPDACPAMCDAYAAQDNRVKVIHKANGGVSSARNAGLRIAKGKYVQFVDSDDYLSSDYTMELCTAAAEEHAVWVWARNTWVGKNGEGVEEFSGLLDGITELSAAELPERFETLYFSQIPSFTCTKLYVRELIRAEFNELVSWSEDFLFNLKYSVGLRGEIAVINSAGYFYDRTNENTALRTFKNFRAESFFAIIHGARDVLEQRKSPGGDQVYAQFLLTRFIYETQYLIYRNAGEKRDRELRNYLLAKRRKAWSEHWILGSFLQRTAWRRCVSE